MNGQILRRTRSLCPICHKNIPARHERDEGGVFLRKSCPRHGAFSSVIWRDKILYEDWLRQPPPLAEGEGANCPAGCGLCPEHRSGTCCVLLEVTNRCNLRCPFCFAHGGENAADRTRADLEEDIRSLVAKGKTLLQFSGGEPTLRDDLPDLIAAARQAGCAYVQLNTNGLRLAREPGYARTLHQAGLSFVFLQFDGMSDHIYQELRGEALFAGKLRAIENCDDANLGVTLVATLVPGINAGKAGDILRFAAENSPAVRGVHFQPVSYFGRIPHLPEDSDRFTLDELLAVLERQLPPKSLSPSCCDHALCGFHGDFIAGPHGELTSLRRAPAPTDGSCGPSPAERNRAFVARRWQRPEKPAVSGNAAPESPAAGQATGCCELDSFYHRVKMNGFTVSAMAFQDAWNLDIERLRQCSLHVYRSGRHIPFCASYALGPRG